jgi:hypothetical protein
MMEMASCGTPWTSASRNVSNPKTKTISPVVMPPPSTWTAANHSTAAVVAELMSVTSEEGRELRFQRTLPM